MSDQHGPADGFPILLASDDEGSSSLLHKADDESSDDEEGPPGLYCDSGSESDNEVLHQVASIYDQNLDGFEGEAAMEISEEDEPPAACEFVTAEIRVDPPPLPGSYHAAAAIGAALGAKTA